MSVVPVEILERLSVAAKAANEAADEYKALTADSAKRMADILNASTDERIVAWRNNRDEVMAKIAEAEAQLKLQEEQAQEYAQSLMAETDGDPKEVRDRYTELRREADSIRKGIELIVRDPEAVQAAIESHGIEEVISLRGTRTKGAATGIRRPRLAAATVNGEDVADKNGNVTMTTLAAAISRQYGKVTADDIRNAAFAAAGTDDLNSLDSGTVVEFGFTVPGIGGGNSTDILVSITTR